MGIMILRMKRMDQLGRGERGTEGPTCRYPGTMASEDENSTRVGANVLTNGSKKTGIDGPFLGNFCGLQRRSKVQGTRSRVRLDIYLEVGPPDSSLRHVG